MPDPMNWTALLLDPNYAAFGVAGELTPSGFDTVDVTVIDKTSAVDLQSLTEADLAVVQPTVRVRMAELDANGLHPRDLHHASLYFDARYFRVESFKIIGSPGGEKDGEAILFLSETD